jgi:hypothetical protein
MAQLAAIQEPMFDVQSERRFIAAMKNSDKAKDTKSSIRGVNGAAPLTLELVRFINYF